MRPQCDRGILVVVVMALALAACQRAGKDRDTRFELQRIQRQVGERAGTNDVSVSLNHGRFMFISIANSPWASLQAAEKRQKGFEMARLALAGVGSRSPVEVVIVTFEVRRSYFAFINYTTSTEVFQFDAGDLEPRSPTPVLSEGWVSKKIPQRDVYFVAVGDVPPALLEDMVAHFKQTLGVRITVLPRLLFDRATFDSARAQIVAEELISAVRARYAALARSDRARIIGVTAYDMYLRDMRPEWQFTFSLRSSDDHVAVVSYARMDPAALGRTPDTTRLEARLRKMVAKNIGIIYYGLPLSLDPRSALYGQIGGVDELDAMSEYFEPR